MIVKQNPANLSIVGVTLSPLESRLLLTLVTNVEYGNGDRMGIFANALRVRLRSIGIQPAHTNLPAPALVSCHAKSSFTDD